MRRREFMRHALACLWLILFAGGLTAAEQATWKAGFARAQITPQKSMWLAGYAARSQPSAGAAHELWVKVLALEAQDGHRAVLVTSDLLGFPRAMSERITAELKAKCGLERSQIMLSASHTHSGPVLQNALFDIYPLDDRQRALIAEYSAGLERTCVQTVAQALQQLTPVVLATGLGTTDFAANRRNNRDPELARVRQQGGKPNGPSDYAVPVLSVRTPAGELRAVVFGYACHATTLDALQWSGDYPGYAQLALEAKHPGAQAMFWAGCGADQNPMPRRTVELCREYGERLARAVEQTLAQPLRPVAPQLRTVWDSVALEFDRSPTQEELAAAVQRGGYEGRWAERLLREKQSGAPFATSCPYPIQVWKLGADQLWIALGGEVVVDYALSFKQHFGATTWVTGYANDVMAYIPSHRVWQEGGYESGAFSVYGLPALRWKEGLEAHLTREVGRLVQQVK